MAIVAIKECGTYLDVTPDGTIVKHASPATIQHSWKPAIDDVVAAYLTHFGAAIHSLYVRGSVAQARATDTLSDLDVVVIFVDDPPETWLTTRWTVDLNATLVRRYPFVYKLDAWDAALSEVSRLRSLRIALQTQTVCVYGADLATELGALGVGKDAFWECLSIQERLVQCVADLETGKHVEIASCCRWIMKHIVRAGFELVMERERRYTHDLYPSYKAFVRHYPHKQAEMLRSLELAVQPTDDKQLLSQILLRWLLWFPNEIAAVCPDMSVPTLSTPTPAMATRAPVAAACGLESHTPSTLA